MIEVELKFALSANSRTLLQTELATLPSIQQFAPVSNVDTYYDTADFVCLQQAVFLRIRDHARLEIKYHELADPTHMHTTERVFPLTAEPSMMQEFNHLCSRFIPYWQDTDTVQAALTTNGLIPFVHIEKQRTLYIHGQLNLCLDQVVGLGNFFEVEMLCTKDAEIVQAQAQLQAFVTSLTLPSLYSVKIGYVELWLRTHLPHVYHLGTYQAEYEQNYMRPLSVSTHVPVHGEVSYAQK